MESFFAEIEDGKLTDTSKRFRGKHKVIITLLEEHLETKPAVTGEETLIVASLGKAFDEFNEDEVEYRIDDLKVRYK